MPVESMKVTSVRSTTTPRVPSSAKPSRRLPSLGAVAASISPRSDTTWVVSSTASSTNPKSLTCRKISPAAMSRHRRARSSYASRRRHARLAAPTAFDARSARVVAHAPLAQVPGAQRQLDAAAPGAVAPAARAGALAAAAVVAARIVVVVAQAEEPDQPDHEQADVEDAEANHEDPPLGGHRFDATAMTERVEALF